MRALLRPRTIFFAVLAVSIGTTAGVVLAAHTMSRVAAPSAGAVSLSLSGHSVRSEASPEPQATESPEPEATESPKPEATESPEAENEAAEPAENQNEPNEEASPQPAPTSSGSSAPDTITLQGGTVTLSCPSSGSIIVDSVNPNPGFTVEQGTEDDNQTVEIRFESSSHESRLQADCSGGQVHVLELREESN